MKNKGNFFKLSIMGLLLSVVLAACGGGGASSGKVLRIARSVPSDTINNLINESSENSLIIDNFSEGLVRYDKNEKLVGGLAESWKNEGTVYTFKLRPNLKWSNDTPITAQDFVFGWQTLMSHPNAPYKFMMEDIKNGKAVAAGTMPASELGIKAVDDRTLEVSVEQERAYILSMLTHSTFFPLNEAFYNEVGAEGYATSADKVLASGAFKLTEYAPDTGYTFVKNLNYWDAGNVKLDEVNVRVIKESATQDTLYQNGELDAILIDSNLYDKYKDDSNLQSFKTASMYQIYLSGNTATPSAALSNRDFRQAVNYAVDKTLLTQSVLKNGSVPLDYLIPQDFGDINGRSYRDFTRVGTGDELRFDVAKAQEYLAKAKETLSDADLNFTLSFGEAEINKLAFENVKGQIETNLPGVRVNLTSVPSSTYFKGLARGDTPSAASGWTPDFRDVATFFQTFTTGNDMNYGRYSNPEYDALYIKAQAELDPAVRANLFKEAETILVNDGAFVPLFQRGRRFLVNEKVEGFHFNVSSPEFSFQFIDIK
jgi:ABC-type oligopeptide transport system substrate-binding subunit